MPMRCPYCASVVEPMRDVQGGLVCPACRNTGRVAFAQPTWSPVGPQGFAQPPPLPQPGVTPALAVVSLVLGVLGIFMVFTVFLAPLAFVFGAVAIGLGIPPLRKGREPPTSGAGRGLAIAGIATGTVGVLIGVAAAIVFGAFFSFLSELEPGTGAEPYIAFDRNGIGPGGTLTVVGVDPGVEWDEFEVSGSASCSAPSGQVEAGDRIVCEVDGRVDVLHWPSGEVVYSTTL